METQRKLQEAALHLFSTRGYDETSIDDVAALAGVGRRTFFRYFPAKEDLLFTGDPGFTLIVPVAEFERARSETESTVVDPSVSDLGAVAALVLALTSAHEQRRQHMVAFAAAIRSSAVLRGRSMDQRIYVERWLAATLVEVRSADPGDARLLARVGVSVLYAALERWIGESRRPLAVEVAAAFDVIDRATRLPPRAGSDTELRS